MNASWNLQEEHCSIEAFCRSPRQTLRLLRSSSWPQLAHKSKGKNTGSDPEKLAKNEATDDDHMLKPRWQVSWRDVLDAEVVSNQGCRKAQAKRLTGGCSFQFQTAAGVHLARIDSR